MDGGVSFCIDYIRVLVWLLHQISGLLRPGMSVDQRQFLPCQIRNGRLQGSHSPITRLSVDTAVERPD